MDVNESPLSRNPTESVEIPLPFPQSVWARILYGLFLVVTPILGFLATELFLPEWQDGELISYIILLLSPPASLLFLPLLLYSVVAYVFLLVSPRGFSRQFFVRLGVYAGVLLALHFTILSAIFLFNLPTFSWALPVLWILPFVVAKAFPWAVGNWGTGTVVIALGGLFAAFIGIAAVATSMIWTPFMYLLAGLTIAAPFWIFLMYLRAASWLFTNHETRLDLPRGLGVAAWLAGYGVAWRFAVLKMYELYAALPPQPPADCYIATAAAHGHPRLVRSRLVLRADGTWMRVNPQLQTLKCAELALMATRPRLHRLLRRGYDSLGKPLARRIRNPFAADVAYLCLKPFEWTARGVLRLLLHDIDSIAGSMYTR